MTMTYEQAAQQALQLKNQGLTYKKIEEHLKGIGYVSERTRRPVKTMSIRYMVSDAEKKLRQENKLEQEEDRLSMYTSELSFKRNLQAVLGIEELSPRMKLKLVEALVEDFSKTTPHPTTEQVATSKGA